MSVGQRLYSLQASTRQQRPGVEWEWRISRDVAERLLADCAPGRTPNEMRTLLGWQVVVMDDATPDTIGLVSTA
jgi:hypothetical protein